VQEHSWIYVVFSRQAQEKSRRLAQRRPTGRAERVEKWPGLRFGRFVVRDCDFLLRKLICRFRAPVAYDDTKSLGSFVLASGEGQFISRGQFDSGRRIGSKLESWAT
jgi:hypothetical protein